MLKVKEVKPLTGYKLWLSFTDGETGTVNIEPFLDRGISLKLLQEDYFSKVSIDQFGGVCWENGFDFSPKTLKSLLINK